MSTFFSKFKIGAGVTKMGIGTYFAYLGLSSLALGPALPIAAFCLALYSVSSGARDVYQATSETNRGPRH